MPLRGDVHRETVHKDGQRELAGEIWGGICGRWRRGAAPLAAFRGGRTREQACLLMYRTTQQFRMPNLRRCGIFTRR